MKIDIVTVFPEMVEAALGHSIVKRARDRGLIAIRVIDLRGYTRDRHRTTDDTPYGGGGGMVMKVEPIARALVDLAPETMRDLLAETETQGVGAPSTGLMPSDLPLLSRIGFSGEGTGGGRSSGIIERPRIVLTDPRGPRFTQETARVWAREPHLIVLCGHYEGVDERVRQHLVTDEVSIGDYILTGGELPALVIVDALTRLQAGALGDAEAPDNDTFADNLLEHPHYTRPPVFHGWSVPEILLCGHHAQIERWRRWHRLRATQERRPDLFARQSLSLADEKLLAAPEPAAPPDPKAIRDALAVKRSAAKRSKAEHEADERPTPAEGSDGRREEEIDGTGTGNDT